MNLFHLIQTCDTLAYDRVKYWKLKRENGRWPSPNRSANRLAQLGTHHVKYLSHVCPSYPTRLSELTAPPPVLFYRGHMHHLLRPSISIIGCRKPSALASKLAYSTAANLVRAGFTIVSGMARGIDSQALRGAYVSENFFFGVAVLGTPITQCYPPENFGLFQTLSQHGLVLSEYPPWFNTHPYHFIFRNELIAALGDVLLVVEAGEKSGTFHTVNAALELGKLVMTFDLPAKGNQRLLQDGAASVKKVDDIFPFIFESLRDKVLPPCGKISCP